MNLCFSSLLGTNDLTSSFKADDTVTDFMTAIHYVNGIIKQLNRAIEIPALIAVVTLLGVLAKTSSELLGRFCKSNNDLLPPSFRLQFDIR